jgi:capsular polysaccharide export protein
VTPRRAKATAGAEAVPWLRSPPFPWVAPTVAAVSMAAPELADDPVRRAEAAAALPAILAAGVGGAFWRGDPGSAPDTAALIGTVAGARYRDPFTGGQASIADTVALLTLWRETLLANRRIAAVAGITAWKRQQLSRFLWAGEGTPPILPPGRALARAEAAGGALAIWPSRVPAGLAERAAAAGVPCWRVEDGFVRSVGLGSDLTLPWSIVVDPDGIYYDPDSGSVLERLLATHPFPQPLVARAEALVAAIRAGGIGKYASGGGEAPPLPPGAAGRRLVLAVGQVADDASVQTGGAGIAGNLPFLAAVRAAEPDAFILYRPHPDVLAGHRTGRLSLADALAHADAVDEGGALLPQLDRADAVHVLSSLAGFEALLRGRAVVVHGRPFYAGWGLTRDLAAQGTARGRRLGVAQLAAAALILYPRYLDPVTRLPCPPEVLVMRHAHGAAPDASGLTRLRRLQGRLRNILALGRSGA